MRDLPEVVSADGKRATLKSPQRSDTRTFEGRQFGENGGEETSLVLVGRINVGHCKEKIINFQFKKYKAASRIDEGVKNLWVK